MYRMEHYTWNSKILLYKSNQFFNLSSSQELSQCLFNMTLYELPRSQPVRPAAPCAKWLSELRRAKKCQLLFKILTECGISFNEIKKLKYNIKWNLTLFISTVNKLELLCFIDKLWWWWLQIVITDYRSTIRAIFICSRNPGRKGEREDWDSFGFQLESRFPGIYKLPSN